MGTKFRNEPSESGQRPEVGTALTLPGHLQGAAGRRSVVRFHCGQDAPRYVNSMTFLLVFLLWSHIDTICSMFSRSLKTFCICYVLVADSVIKAGETFLEFTFLLYQLLTKWNSLKSFTTITNIPVLPYKSPSFWSMYVTVLCLGV